MPLLAWDANTEPDLSHYRLYWRESSAQVWSARNITNQTTWNLPLPFGTYVFALTALNMAGRESPPAVLSWTNLPVYSVNLEKSPYPTGPWITSSNLSTFLMDFTGESGFYRVRMVKE